MKEYIAITLYAEVDSRSKNLINAVNIYTGDSFSISGENLVNKTVSSDLFHKVEKVTRTRMVELLLGAGDKPFTVVFDKKEGEERKLRGKLIMPEPLMGRSMAEDFDIKEGNKLRQIDHRTLKSLILNGVFYELK